MDTLDRATNSARIRARLDHPVIDADGHLVEYMPAFVEFLKTVGGADIVGRFEAQTRLGNRHRWYNLSRQEVRDLRIGRPPFWAMPTRNTLDRATAMLPKLLRERLDSFGIDYSIVYPTLGFTLPEIEDAEIRGAACRAYNEMVAELFAPYGDRLTPAAVIPAATPAEAIAELEHAVGTLGLKVAMVDTFVKRPIAAVAARHPEIAREAYWIDSLALDSAYDYDPLWAKCVELGVAVTSHSQAQGHGTRRSITNYMYNQTGHFAEAAEAFCKAVFFGGVTRRFPKLTFAFLECGAGFACNLYAGLVERWKKRNRDAVRNYDPQNLDRALLDRLIRDYGDARFRASVVAAEAAFAPRSLDIGLGRTEFPGTLDDFAALAIERAEDVRDRFVPNFFFGCEADDPMTIMAFNRDAMPFQAALGAMFGSDIGHWDVPDMTETVAEAHEMLEHGQIGADDFKEFMFGNAVRLHATMNPRFFEGTVVADAVARHMSRN